MHFTSYEEIRLQGFFLISFALVTEIPEVLLSSKCECTVHINGQDTDLDYLRFIRSWLAIKFPFATTVIPTTSTSATTAYTAKASSWTTTSLANITVRSRTITISHFSADTRHTSYQKFKLHVNAFRYKYSYKYTTDSLWHCDTAHFTSLVKWS